jgi:DNA (cytosine-5)-methyltransferase 1
VAQVEIDEYACKVLAKHWPDVARYGDIRSVGAANLPAADCLVGGFPCQDISDAGKRIGIGGARSGLWGEYARLIGELRPRYIVVENVAALLGRGMGTVCGDLAALRYDAEWHCIPAAAVGAPHIRDRVFLLAYPNRTERGPRAQGRHESDRHDPRWQETASRFTARGSYGWAGILADTDDCRRDRRAGIIGPAGRRQLANGSWWAVEPGVGRVAHGVPARVDRLKGLGNAVVPQVAEYIGRCLVAFDAQQNEGAA